MTGGAGRFRLADGEIVDLYADGLRAVYEHLWVLADQPGAVSAAALLLHAQRSAARPWPIQLDERQTAAFKLAQSRLAT